MCVNHVFKNKIDYTNEEFVVNSMLYKKLLLYLLPGTNRCFKKEFCICRFVLDSSLHFAVFRMVFSGYDRGRFTFGVRGAPCVLPSGGEEPQRLRL